MCRCGVNNIKRRLIKLNYPWDQWAQPAQIKPKRLISRPDGAIRSSEWKEAAWELPATRVARGSFMNVGFALVEAR